MKITFTNITEGMNSSHEGYAELVADSVSFSSGRVLTDEEHKYIYNNIQRAVYDALGKLEISETKPEICRCAVISNAHMTQKDSEILDSLSPRLSGEDGAYHRIHPTRFGFLIRLSASLDAIEELRMAGLSDYFCHIVGYLSEECHASMVFFDADADLIEGFTVHNW